MRVLYYILFISFAAYLTFSCSTDDPGVGYPTDGLVSYFDFNGNLSDKMSNTPDGTGNMDPLYSDGWIGQALTINTAGQVFEFDRKSYHSDKKFSVSVWFKTTTSAANRTMINVTDFLIYTDQTDIKFFIPTPISLERASGNFLDNTWMHFAGTYDGQDLRIYINGVLKDVVADPNTAGAFPLNLKIGGSSNEHWTGSLDELFIYNKTLSQDEVDQLFRM